MQRDIEEFLAYIGTERGLSPKTVRAYRYDLGKFAEFVKQELGQDCGVDRVVPQTIRSYMQFLAEKGYRMGNSAVSRGRKLATLKSFYRYLFTMGKVHNDPVKTVRMPKIQQKEPSYLSEQEYKRLLMVIQKTATPYFIKRDQAIITVFLGMGLRLSELVGLNVGSVNLGDGSIKVKRKGNLERILPANEEVLESIREYLKTRGDVAGREPLLLSKRNRRIDNATVWHLVKKYMKQARLEKDRLSPHTLRHTFATTLLRKGENILTIKELLSHRNLHTTQRYLHINNDDLKAAVNRIDLVMK